MEHLSQKQVEDFSQQQLRAAELLSVTDHLGECETCRRRTEAAMNGDATFLALHDETFESEVSEHLTMEQLAEYVDKNLSGETLQFATDHLSSCEQCAFAVNDLRDFRNEIAPSLDRDFTPAHVSSSAPGWWRRTFASVASIFGSAPVPAFGGAALAVLLFAVVGWLILRTPQRTEPELAVSPTPLSQPSPLMSPEFVPSPPSEVAPVVVAQLNDAGGQLTLDRDGKLTGADNLPPAYQELLKKAISTQKVERSSQLQGLTRASSSLMSSGNQKGEFSLIDPVGDVLMSNEPSFRWSAMEDATGYVVEVYDEQFKLVASSPQLTGLSWTTTLPRGKVYSWQVKATKDGQEITSPRPPAPQAKFRVVDQAKVNELARAKRAYGSSHLTLGLLYAEAGLLKEAEQEFRALRRANPNSAVARNLLRQVQALRR